MSLFSEGQHSLRIRVTVPPSKVFLGEIETSLEPQKKEEEVMRVVYAN